MNVSTTRTRAALGFVVLCLLSAVALADGLIVPVRPEIRVRGSWAVKYHHVEIKVRDQVAAVTIDQAFVNTCSGMIEVEYLFPVPPGAAIDSMTLVVDGKEYAAQLHKAEKARQIYEQIVRRKKDPALLEYVGYGLYKTSAFPLQPGKPARVVVTYKSLCHAESNLVEVWYPLNTEKFSARPIGDVEVNIDIRADADIASVYSPTHEVSVQRDGDRRVKARYKATDVLPDRDIQVFYKLTPGQVGATFLAHRPRSDEDGYFMLLVSPNPSAGRDDVIPKDVVLVVDRSGSMGGKKLAQVQEAVNSVLGRLNAEDRFNVLAYSDSVEAFFAKLAPVNKKTVAEARDVADRMTAAGGTNIHEALLAALEQFSAGPKGRPKYVLFLTDGLPTIGERDEAAILRAIDKADEAGVRVFAFGVGYDVNSRLLTRLAEDNGGRCMLVKPAENVQEPVAALYRKIRNPVMTDLEMAIDGLKLRDVYPRDLGDLFAGDQIVAVGRFEPRRGGRGEKANLTLRGHYKGEEKAFEYRVDLGDPGPSLRYAFVEKLWAVRRVGYLLEQVQLHGASQEVTDEIVRLSTRYGIMTPYTSFLADETTELAASRGDRGRWGRETESRLRADGPAGAGGHRRASNLDQLKHAQMAEPPAPAASASGAADGVALAGHASKDAYEKGQAEVVRGVKKAGDTAVYRRGKTWMAANAADVDLRDPKVEIHDIERFSNAYFQLAETNTIEENRILASQAEGQTLIIRLRGKVYRIR